MIRQLKEIDKAVYAVKVGLLISDFPGVFSNIGKIRNFIDSLQVEVSLRKRVVEYRKEDRRYAETKNCAEKDLL